MRAHIVLKKVVAQGTTDHEGGRTEGFMLLLNAGSMNAQNTEEDEGDVKGIREHIRHHREKEILGHSSKIIPT